MRTGKRTVQRGLEDVVAAETQISLVDPNGQLYYSGYNIDDLADKVSYEEAAYLLWHNKLPTESELSHLRHRLINEMTLPQPVNQLLETLAKTLPTSHPMDVLSMAVTYLKLFDPDTTENTIRANIREAIRLTAKIPTIIANFHRFCLHKLPITPDNKLNLAQNYLYMFRGSRGDEREGEAFEKYMVLHAEHGLNASTFAARVTASTRSDMYSAIVSAIGTLRGPLHGGASEKVMNMLNDINHSDEVNEYIKGLTGRGKRIMGFGHRIYQTEDPRAKHLRKMSKRLLSGMGRQKLHTKAEKIEEIVRKRKKIYPNVDFYAATVMHAMDIPKSYFPVFFASSRIVGWTAHIMEQYSDNRLIRPTSKYAGYYGRPFVPIENRGITQEQSPKVADRIASTTDEKNREDSQEEG